MVSKIAEVQLYFLFCGCDVQPNVPQISAGVWVNATPHGWAKLTKDAPDALSYLLHIILIATWASVPRDNPVSRIRSGKLAIKQAR